MVSSRFEKKLSSGRIRCVIMATQDYKEPPLALCKEGEIITRATCSLFPPAAWEPPGLHLVVYPFNPTDRDAWQDPVHRVAKSWTQPKRLSTHTLRYSHKGPFMKPQNGNFKQHFIFIPETIQCYVLTIWSVFSSAVHFLNIFKHI